MKKIRMMVLVLFLVGCTNPNAPFASQQGSGLSLTNNLGQTFNLIELEVYVNGVLVENMSSMYADHSKITQGDNYYISSQGINVIYPNQKVELDISLYDVQPTKKLFSSSISSSNPRVLVSKAKVNLTGVKSWIDLNALNATTIQVLNQK